MLNHKKIVAGIVFGVLCASTLTRATASQIQLQANANVSSQKSSDTDVQKETNDDIQISKVEKPKIITYVVKSGDTIEKIANTYEIKISTITESNRITKNTTLKEGLSLEFPSIDGVLYKIKGGETLWDLANDNNININDLIKINKLQASEKLKLGQKLVIPGVEKVKAAALNSSESANTSSLSRGGSSVKASSIKGIWPTKGTISSYFGSRWGKKHEGIDIAASSGTDVNAFLAGKVIYSGWEEGYGNLVIIDHGNGLQSYYGHNSKLLAKAGQSVKIGAHIAEVGSTGHSTGPHSHFEIRKNGTPVNPLAYLN